MSNNWCTIESDPGVFTELIQKFGVIGAEFEELYTLDLSLLEDKKPIFGFIFLFKWVPLDQLTRQKQNQQISAQFTGKILKPEETPENLFFASQIITNSCATQAILSILLNIDETSPLIKESGFTLGKSLTEFKEFTKALGPGSFDLKGMTISESNIIRETHNSFCTAEPFVPAEFSDYYNENDQAKDEEKEDVFHFVAFLEKDGKLYELDGLKPGPILLGDIFEEHITQKPKISSENNEKSEQTTKILTQEEKDKIRERWYEKILPFIEEKIAKYSDAEIKFNLMALTCDKESILERKLSEIEEKEAILMSKPNVLKEEEKSLEEEKKSVSAALEQEKAKKMSWKLENTRRRHNYLPFLVNYLKILAEKDILFDLVTEAKELKAKAKQQQMQYDLQQQMQQMQAQKPPSS